MKEEQILHKSGLGYERFPALEIGHLTFSHVLPLHLERFLVEAKPKL